MKWNFFNYLFLQETGAKSSASFRNKLKTSYAFYSYIHIQNIEVNRQVYYILNSSWNPHSQNCNVSSWRNTLIRLTHCDETKKRAHGTEKVRAKENLKLSHGGSSYLTDKHQASLVMPNCDPLLYTTLTTVHPNISNHSKGNGAQQV